MSNKIPNNWKITEGQNTDSRNFTEKTFLINNGNKLEPKKVVLYDASDSEPEEYPPELITVLANYKQNIQRGRKDPLKNRDVIALRTGKGVYYIPLEEAQAFATNLYSLATAIINKRSK